MEMGTILSTIRQMYLIQTQTL